MSVEVKVNGEWRKVAGGTLYADAPVGSILAFGGSSAPSGWLLCQGQAVSRTTYAELFKAIGTSFGSGDGSATFNLPDLREATTKGVGLSGKSSNHYDSDGVALGEFIEDRNKSHTHDMSNHTHSGTTNSMNRNAEHNHRILTIGSTQAGATYVSGTSDGGSLIYTTTEVANTDHEHTFTTGAPSNNATGSSGSATNEVKAVGVNYIIKAVQSAVPADIAAGVEKQVDSSLAVQQSDVAVTFGGFTAQNAYVKRTGNNVQFYFSDVQDHSGTSLSGWTTIGTLPEGFRPSATIYDFCGGVNSTMLVQINSSGRVQVYFNNNLDYEFIANMNFIADD